MGRGKIPSENVELSPSYSVYVSSIEKPAEQDALAEKVRSTVDCYIKRKKVVMATTSAPVAEADEGYDTVH